MGLLSMKEVKEKVNALKGWEIYHNLLQKSFSFDSFQSSMRFVNEVAALAESADHHPDILISYKRVLLKLVTHSKGGITEKDFNLAEKIDESEKVFSRS